MGAPMSKETAVAAIIAILTAGVADLGAQQPSTGQPPAGATPQQFAARSVTLVSVQVDPIVPPSTTTSGKLTLRNGGAALAKVLLSFGQPRRGTAAAGAKARFLAGSGDVHIPQYYRPQYYIEIGGRNAAEVPFEVSDVTAPGAITLPLLDFGEQLGDLTIDRLPFAITADTSAITVIGDRPVSVVLTNADPASYTTDVALKIGGQSLCPKPLDGRAVRSCLGHVWPWADVRQCGAQSVVLPANQKKTVQFYPNCQVSSGIVTGLLRDEPIPSNLVITARDARAGAPAASDIGYTQLDFGIPVTVGYGYLSDFWRQLWSTVLLGGVLVLGGIASLLARYWVPNEQSRRRLLARLDQFDIRSNELSDAVGSDLRLALRVNGRRLRQLLRDVPAVSADTTATLAQCETRIRALEAKAEAIEGLERASRAVRRISADGAPPSVLNAITGRLSRAAEQLGSDAFDQVGTDAAHTEIDAVLTTLDKGVVVDDGFRKVTEERAAALKDSFATEAALKDNPIVTEFRQLLHGPFAVLDSPPQGDAWTDTSLAILEIIRDYLRLAAVAAGSCATKPIADRRAELVCCLSSPAATGLRKARLLIRQMQEGIYEADIVDAIRRGEVSIESDPKSFGSYQLVRLAVRFHRTELNDAAAREAITCLWHFGPMPDGIADAHSNAERGWEVRHYFISTSRSDPGVAVQTLFLASNGSTITCGSSPSSPVAISSTFTPRDTDRSRSGRMRAEWVGLAVVLFIALLGLVTGAREQITKLDLVPGLIAVFLLGFGADSLKNLLAPQADTASPH